MKTIIFFIRFLLTFYGKKEEKIPFHRRFGLRRLQVLLIVLSLVLVKRCVDIYYENKQIGQQIEIEYNEKGYANGMKKSRVLPAEPGTPVQELRIEKILPECLL